MVRYFIINGNERIGEIQVRDGHYITSSRHPDAINLVEFLESIYGGRPGPMDAGACLTWYARQGANAYNSTQVIVAVEPILGLGNAVRYDRFRDLATGRRIVDLLVEHVETECLLGRRSWAEQLAAYNWSRGKSRRSQPLKGWLKGVADRKQNALYVQEYQAGRLSFDDMARKIISEWGGIHQPLSSEVKNHARFTMGKMLVSCELGDDTPHCGERIASVSKLYASQELDHWVIYDSRVAAALTYLFEATGIVEDPHEEVAASGLDLARVATFVVMPAKQEPRPKDPGKVEAWKARQKLRILPGYPRYSASNHEQAFMSFVAASWICRAIAEALNEMKTPLPDGEPGDWKAFHIEMVLFMLGEDLNKFPKAVALVEHAELLAATMDY